jgi:pyruvate kinase
MGSIFGRLIGRKPVPAVPSRPKLDLMVTMWPSFPHFAKFALDRRLAGVRLNTAMVRVDEIADELLKASLIGGAPFWVDVKGRQLRVVESRPYKDHLELVINHPIRVQTPVEVVFKAGEDWAVLKEVVDHGHRLVFDGGPEFMVKDGESLHIRHPSMEVGGDQFSEAELEKISAARKAGITRFFLSYVQSQRDVDEFRRLVGKDAQVILKIEDNKGLQYVAEEFRKTPGTSLMAARGDLYVEIERPHRIAEALRLIIRRDPEASVGSRILLSVVNGPVPSCADFLELAWLADIGYRKFLLCDELCLRQALLSAAVDAFDQFRQDHRLV